MILVRDNDNGLETLLMRRNSRLSFAEGMWVFPGGRVDRDDHPAGRSDEAAAAVTAAVREAEEEAGLVLDPGTLVRYAHWLPPKEAPKRFSTWFFVAPAPPTPVAIDEGEIVDHVWTTPADALERHAADLIELMPPTWMTLHDLGQWTTVADCLTAIADRPPRHYETRIAATAAGRAALWSGDVGYDGGDPDRSGARHRLLMSRGGWSLEVQTG